MKMMIALFICMFPFPLFLFAQRAADRLDTGNDFLRQCDESGLNRKDPVAVGQYMHCVGYVRGFLEGHSALIVVSGAKPSYCLAENVDTGQVRRIVTKFLRDHPDKTHLPISVLIEKTLIDAFPCPK